MYRSHEYVAIATNSTDNGSDFIQIHVPLKLDLFPFTEKKKKKLYPKELGILSLFNHYNLMYK